MEVIMAYITNEDIAATLASGIVAAGAYDLRSLPPVDQAGVAVKIYRECLEQLRTPEVGT